VLFNLVPRGKTPAVTLPELEDFGYALVIIPGACLGPAVAAVTSALTRLRGGDLALDGQTSPRELFDSLGLPFWESLQQLHNSEDTHA
jgi:2-methylisocitrate lyase-like PEP mutase family enzyme